MSQMEIAKSIELLEKDWDVEPIIKDFQLGKRDDVTENSIRVKDVIFHIPFLNKIKKFILWKCYWPIVQTAVPDREDFLSLLMT